VQDGCCRITTKEILCYYEYYNFNVNHPVVFLKFIQDTNSSQTQQVYYIITFKATCFNSVESSSGLLENRSSVSTFVVHTLEYTINVDTLDLFSRRPGDDSIQLKHVALNVII